MIQEIDARTAPDEVLLAFYELETACHEEVSPGEPPRSAAEVIAFHRHQPTSHTTCWWRADGGMAAVYAHGPTATFLQLLVDPSRRRRGTGSALLAAARDRARELGATVLHGQHTTPAGATDGQRIVKSLLDLRAANLPEARVPAGWSLVTWLGRVPDEHLAAYVVARAAMDDAPSPEELDFPTWTADDVRASEESLARREREMRLTVALHESGQIGAFSELRVSQGSTLGFTDDTGTLAEHRGQGLARAVKVESLRRLRTDHPEVEVVVTSNAEENAVMRHINESVGFRPTVVFTTATLTL